MLDQLGCGEPPRSPPSTGSFFVPPRLPSPQKRTAPVRTRAPRTPFFSEASRPGRGAQAGLRLRELRTSWASSTARGALHPAAHPSTGRFFLRRSGLFFRAWATFCDDNVSQTLMLAFELPLSEDPPSARHPIIDLVGNRIAFYWRSIRVLCLVAANTHHDLPVLQHASFAARCAASWAVRAVQFAA
jgi:hypothetical protein